MNNKFVKSFMPVATLVLVILLLSRNNGVEEKVIKRTRVLMDTVVEITLFNEGDAGKNNEAVSAAFDEIKRLENLLGRHQEGSDIRQANTRPGKGIKVSPETLEVMNSALRFSKISGGAFDITVGKLSELWNFEEGRKTPPHEDEIKSALQGSGASSVTLDLSSATVKTSNKVHLDLGGIAKGYIIDKAAKILLAKGIEDFIINAGGDMVIRGKKKGKQWRIGIQHPRKKGEVIAHIDVEENESAIVTSGDYERFFTHKGKRYHHILSPKTGYPADELMSVTIKAEDAVTADALSTAIFVLGPTEGLKLIESLQGVEGMLIDKDRNIVVSKGLAGKVKVR
ncbi:MAG: FAD:protein FMN transferase [Deltaproteobacteria bacterium]|nr:FAD:protein FMN transferase [Deltaproteobacteria bacterium]